MIEESEVPSVSPTVAPTRPHQMDLYETIQLKLELDIDDLANKKAEIEPNNYSLKNIKDEKFYLQKLNWGKSKNQNRKKSLLLCYH